MNRREHLAQAQESLRSARKLLRVALDDMVHGEVMKEGELNYHIFQAFMQLLDLLDQELVNILWGAGHNDN
jgi:hypothetical protein